MNTSRLGVLVVGLALGAGCSKSETDAPAPAPALPQRTSPDSSAGSTAMPPAAHKVPHGKPWYTGTVKAALAEAKQQNKPVFLYWGAVWCPPCNSIKAAVFAHPRFAQVVAPFVSVYLDGDTARAQAWGEKLKVVGYPTLLFLDPSGRELLRISAGLTLGDFENAVASVRATMRPVDDTIALARAGKAKKADWQQLARVDGYALATRGKKPADIVDTLVWLAGAIPPALGDERAAASANALVAAATTTDKAAAAAVARAKARAPKFLATALAGPRAHRAAREMILHSAAEVLRWMFGAESTPALNEAVEAWLAAARGLRNQSDLPVVSRMDTLWPELDLYRLRHPTGKVPAELAKRVVDTVTLHVALLTTPQLRKAGISSAVQLLARAGAVDEARKLLDAELKTTTTPWYYMSSYASLEKRANNHEAALVWARKARLAAKGGATRLQWIANDLKMTVQLPSADKAKRTTELVKAFYDLLFQLPDGFFGRNHRVARRVGKTLEPLLASEAAFRSMLGGYAKKCDALAKRHQRVCTKYFDDVLKASRS